jgi:hypothetical protein
LPPPPPPPPPPHCIKDREKAAREEESDRTKTQDYWAPKPRITGITPRIRNRARGRQSATVFAVPVSPLSTRFAILLSFHLLAVLFLLLSFFLSVPVHRTRTF